jgi:mannose-1-phosphate guanylyltransferase
LTHYILDLADIYFNTSLYDYFPSTGTLASTSTAAGAEAKAVNTASTIATCAADTAAFQNTVRFALPLAAQDHLVTFGITPTRPETGYGYIERGPLIREQGTHRAFQVKRFHEKPNIERATSYLQAGTYYWNAGIFLWKARTFLEEFARYYPETREILDTPHVFREQLDKLYALLPETSVDYAIMEKTRRAAVVEARFAWDDLGSYLSLRTLYPEDARGNHLQGPVVLEEADGNLIIAEGGAVVVRGLRDMVVVHTPEVTLIVPLKDAQRVKALYRKFKETLTET